MRVTANETEYCKLHVEYEADPNTVEKFRHEGVGELRKFALPGFRAGKAPDSVIKLKLKNQLDHYVKSKMHNQAYEDALFSTKAKGIGQPTFSRVMLKDNHFTCEMVIPKKPDFQLGQYKEIPIKKQNIGIDLEEQTDAMMNNLCNLYGEVSPYSDDQFVEIGDQVSMNLSYTKDGQTVDENGLLYTVGENRYPGFDKSILGMKAGESKEFDLGGVPHKVQIHMGTKKRPCEITDELAKQVGLGSANEIRDKLKAVVVEKIKDAEGKVYRHLVVEKLVKMHDFKLPDFLVTLEAQYKSAQDQKQFASLPEEEKEKYLGQAEDSVRLSFILDSIRDEEPEAVMADMEAIQSLAKRAAFSGKDPQQFLSEVQAKGLLAGLTSALKDEFTVQWVVNQAKIEEKENV